MKRAERHRVAIEEANKQKDAPKKNESSLPLGGGEKTLNNNLTFNLVDQVQNYVGGLKSIEEEVELIPRPVLIKPPVILNLVQSDEERKKELEALEDKMDQMLPEALCGSQDEIAVMVVEMLMGSAKFVSKTGGIIRYWNNNTRLWDEGTSDTLVNHIMVNVRPMLKALHLVESKRCEEDSVTEKQKAACKRLLQLINNLGTVSYCRAIGVLVMERIYDKDFVNILDSCNHLLAVKTGFVMDLRTSEVRLRTMKDYFSFECPVIYNPEAKCQYIDNFLDAITCGDKSFLSYLQYILGYCLTGDISRKEMYILYGPQGNNGKTTVMELLRAVLGPFYHQAHKEVFIKDIHEIFIVNSFHHKYTNCSTIRHSSKVVN